MSIDDYFQQLWLAEKVLLSNACEIADIVLSAQTLNVSTCEKYAESREKYLELKQIEGEMFEKEVSERFGL